MTTSNHFGEEIQVPAIRETRPPALPLPLPIALALATALAVLLPAPNDARAGDVEEILLRGGALLRAEIVADRPDFLLVDLGHDVVKIPVDQIARRSKLDDAPADPDNPPGVEIRGLYRTGRLVRRPVKELVETFGEAVVSIETPSSVGSGFIIAPEGYAVTNCHVIEGETKVAAVLYIKSRAGTGFTRRRVENVEIVALHPSVDLALVKLPEQPDLKLSPVTLGNIEDLRAGDEVFAVGSPLGLERSVTQGILSTLNRYLDGQVYLQTDTAINPGNSGGPLFNARGEVVGVTNMKASQGDNVGFAIPVYVVKEFLRNWETFAYNKENPNTGYRYFDAPRRRNPEPPRFSPGKAPE